MGTAVALLARTGSLRGTKVVQFRDFWGRSKRADLLASLHRGTVFQDVEPRVDLGYPFMPRNIQTSYLNWPRITDLFPVFFAGVQTNRDADLVEIDRERLVQRMERYFDTAVSEEEVRKIAPAIMNPAARFDWKRVRDYLLQRGIKRENFVRFCYRPFDVRWLYWEPETKLINEKRSEYLPHVFPPNRWIVTQQRPRREWDPPQVITPVGCLDLMDRSASFIPLLLAPSDRPKSLFDAHSEDQPRANLSGRAAEYLAAVGGGSDDLFLHAISMLHAPAYRAENEDPLRQDWPRIPLPADRIYLHASAELGRQVATLLDSENPVPGVTSGNVRQELRVLSSATRVGEGQIPDEDFALTAGWGHTARGGAVMPGRGRTTERPYTDDERAMIEAGAVELGLDPAEAVAILGETCIDVYLNDRAYWRCVPVGVWEYTLGGYQVVKKWLSYREQPLLGRALTLDEVREVTGMVRRIAALLLMGPALDSAYAAVKGATYAWTGAVGNGAEGGSPDD